MKNKSFGRRISAKWLLLLILLSLTVSTLLLVYLAQTVFLDAIYQEHKKAELLDIRDRLLATDDDEQRIEVSSALGREHIACIAVYEYSRSKEGVKQIRPIYNYESIANCNCVIHRLLTLRPKDHLSGPGSGRMIVDSIENTLKQNKNWLLVEGDNGDEKESLHGNGLTGIAISKQQETMIVYFINTSTVPMDSTVKTANTLLWYTGVVVIFNTALLALILAFWITKPIERINETVKQFARYNYNVHFSGKGYKEVAELSDSLNLASKVDNLQKELIANISHDLRTPITLISGYAEAMRDLPSEMTEENLTVIIDESNRMKALVNDVLDITKIKEGLLPLNTERFSLTEAIETELIRYNALREKEGFQIDFQYDGNAVILADKTRITQVVYNLVNNAINYCGKDKRVVVKQTLTKHHVRISVTDTGEGIPPEQLPLIWDRYYKVDKTHKRASIGTGLGLSIVKEIVAGHAGSCGVQSTPGKGSTFWFELSLENAEQ